MVRRQVLAFYKNSKFLYFIIIIMSHRVSRCWLEASTLSDQHFLSCASVLCLTSQLYIATLIVSTLNVACLFCLGKQSRLKTWEPFHRFSPGCTLREALTRYLDLTSIPTPQMLSYLARLVSWSTCRAFFKSCWHPSVSRLWCRALICGSRTSPAWLERPILELTVPSANWADVVSCWCSFLNNE